MKLAVHKRTPGKKGEINQLRREGFIPGILYGHDTAGTPVSVKGDEIQAVIRNLKQPGLLATTVFELQNGDRKQRAVIKDIQYHVASYDIMHIDFALLADDKQVTVNVPIQLVGAADCVGVKLGGFIRQVIRTLKVTCLPKHIPQQFTLDIRELNVAQSKTLGDIEMPANVKPIGKMSEVAVLIAKKAGAA